MSNQSHRSDLLHVRTLDDRTDALAGSLVSKAYGPGFDITPPGHRLFSTASMVAVAYVTENGTIELIDLEDNHG